MDKRSMAFGFGSVPVALIVSAAAAQTFNPSPGDNAECPAPLPVLFPAFEGENFRYDPDLGVGRCHVLAVRNLGVGNDVPCEARAFTKAGTLGALDTWLVEPKFGLGGYFWPAINPSKNVSSWGGDSGAWFEAATGRFWMSTAHLEHDTVIFIRTHVAFAVSAGSDPNGPWYKYYLLWGSDPPPPPPPDRPRLAFDDDTAYVVASPDKVVLLDKAALMDGTAPMLIEPEIGVNAYLELGTQVTPAQVWGPYDPSANVPVYMIAVPGPVISADKVVLHAIRKDLSPPQGKTVDICVPEYWRAGGAAQPGSTVKIGVGEDGARKWTCAYRNGSLWAVHTVSSSDNGPPEVRWYEFRMNGWRGEESDPVPELVQSGVVPGPAGSDSFFGSIAVDAFGNVAITYNRARVEPAEPGANEYVSFWRTHRCHTDPLGQLREPILVQAGPAPYEGAVGNNWGDYSGTVPDPVAPSLFWGHQMLPKEPPSSSEPALEIKSWIAGFEIDCGLDLDGDGLATINDVALFYDLFQNGAPQADYNSDGVIDSADLTAYHIDMGLK